MTFVDCLLAIAEVEWEHEQYFRRSTESPHRTAHAHMAWLRQPRTRYEVDGIAVRNDATVIRRSRHSAIALTNTQRTEHLHDIEIRQITPSRQPRIRDSSCGASISWKQRRLAGSTQLA